MKLKHVVLPLAAAGMLFACGTGKKASKNKESNTAAAPANVVKPDTTKTPAPVAYNKVITSKAITQRGLFTIHNIDDNWYFEIPDSLLGRDILMVSRISKSATELRSYGTMTGYGGDLINKGCVQFSRGPGNKIFLKGISFLEQSSDTSENGMSRSIENSNLPRILAAFDIKAFTPDSTGIVINMTDYIKSDNNVLFFTNGIKSVMGLAAYQPDKSYISSIRSYPMNIEIKAVKTYGTDNPPTNDGELIVDIKNAANSFELNTSIVLLPANPMRLRYWDGRIGYFRDRYRDFGLSQGITSVIMIRRWRLEPKKEDEEKYRRGELVEPQKPIVFYIDPATPKKWMPYLIQGVNDWQKAFEKAGFKNAIYAREVSKEDTAWSLEDARHNAIVYKASSIQNASGPPTISDPRTGEILETHINWYHNVTKLLHDWYMIQAGPIDPRARKMEFDDELMGRLIRFVSSHEVGHTLGLEHNFGASSTVPVDSLRSKQYVEANGICPSIMDYARFNYVAQPEDNISEKGIFPRIGKYDEWAINWGYRWLPQFKTPKEESVYLHQWITETVNKDKQLWYGPQWNSMDPRCQPEDLGDNAMKASELGIKNLKRVLEHLPDWSFKSGEDYFNLAWLYKAVLEQYLRYLNSAGTFIGTGYFTPRIADEKKPVIEMVPEKMQREAFQFLKLQVFDTPLWLENDKIYSLTTSGRYTIQSIQELILHGLLSADPLVVMNTYGCPYTAGDLLEDCRNAIWSELKTHRSIDRYRRNLQRMFVATLKNSLSKQLTDFTAKSDVDVLIRLTLKAVIKDINDALPGYKDKMTVLHLQDIREIVQQVLDSKKSDTKISTPNRRVINFDSWNKGLNTIKIRASSIDEGCRMWEEK